MAKEHYKDFTDVFKFRSTGMAEALIEASDYVKERRAEGKSVDLILVIDPDETGDIRIRFYNE